eukprot:TRINITY_DN8873_c0_g1_i1.p1 TRINITY_DN8873_c0_g1~~TRINITY_DN8873_c0_g1_i1.p1  ORF type:complete len:52 (-),score=11.85 TRINITY_DN8873_c0_g1_i1:152-307(-)
MKIAHNLEIENEMLTAKVAKLEKQIKQGAGGTDNPKIEVLMTQITDLEKQV